MYAVLTYFKYFGKGKRFFFFTDVQHILSYAFHAVIVLYNCMYRLVVFFVQALRHFFKGLH